MPQVFKALGAFDSTDDIDNYIRERADVTKDLLIKEAYCELMRVWTEMEKKERIPDGPHLLYSAAQLVPGLMEWVAAKD